MLSFSCLSGPSPGITAFSAVNSHASLMSLSGIPKRGCRQQGQRCPFASAAAWFCPLSSVYLFFLCPRTILTVTLPLFWKRALCKLSAM